MSPEDYTFLKGKGLDLTYKDTTSPLPISNLDDWIIYLLTTSDVTDVEKDFGTWYLQNYGGMDIVSWEYREGLGQFVSCLNIKHGPLWFKSVFTAYQTIENFNMIIEDVWYQNEETGESRLIEFCNVGIHTNLEVIIENPVKAFQDGVDKLKYQILEQILTLDYFAK